MTLPFSLPDWMPWWVSIVVVVPVLLFALAFLFMPFSVFGVKGRLEAVEARLDEIQGEIRSLALRLPERGEGALSVRTEPHWVEDDLPPIPPAARPARPLASRPAIRLAEPVERPAPPANRRVDPARARAEPRLDQR